MQFNPGEPLALCNSMHQISLFSESVRCPVDVFSILLRLLVFVNSSATTNICITKYCLQRFETVTCTNIAPVKSWKMHYFSPRKPQNLVFFGIKTWKSLNVCTNSVVV